MARLPLLTLLALSTVVLGACSKPLGRPLDHQAVAALYRDQTAIGYHQRKNFAFRRYFSPDGTLLAWNDARGYREGRWRVEQDGRHCVQMHHARERCRDIYLGEDGIYRKYGWVWYGYRLLITYRRFQPGDQHQG